MESTSVYTDLIEKVLQVKCLAQQVESLLEPDVLNLATPKWKECLENYHRYQDLMKSVKSEYTPERISTSKVFRSQNLFKTLKVIVIAKCYAPKKLPTNTDDRFCIVLQNCPALSMLVKAMNSDVNPDEITIIDSVRANFDSCNSFCQYCNQARQEMKMNRLKHQPCILDMAIYNGKAVVNRFSSQTSGLFSTSCIAIVKLRINARYFYEQKETGKDAVRVSGDGMHVIAFPESNLKQSTFCLGDLSTISELNNEEEVHIMDESVEKSSKRELEEDIEEIMPGKFPKTDETCVISEELVEIM